MNRVIKTDGTETELIPTGKKGVFTLEALQEAVGGYIAVVHIPGDRENIMLVNEEGLLRRLPFNAKATALVGLGPLVGNVAVIQRRLFK